MSPWGAKPATDGKDVATKFLKRILFLVFQLTDRSSYLLDLPDVFPPTFSPKFE
jgi:hypothetical protein